MQATSPCWGVRWQMVFCQSPKNPQKAPRTLWYLIWRTYKGAARSGVAQNTRLSHRNPGRPAVLHHYQQERCQQPVCRCWGEELRGSVSRSNVPKTLADFQSMAFPHQAVAVDRFLQVHHLLSQEANEYFNLKARLGLCNR